MSENTVRELTAEEIGPEMAAMLEAMARPMPPAPEVVTLPRVDVEAILRELEDAKDAKGGINAVTPSQSILLLREVLALPKVELWAIHSVGPGEHHPCLSKEDAEQQAQAIRDACMQVKEAKIAKGESVEYWPDPVINVIPSPWEPAEHFEIAAEEWQEEAERLRMVAIESANKIEVLSAGLDRSSAVLGTLARNLPDDLESTRSWLAEQRDACEETLKTHGTKVKSP